MKTSRNKGYLGFLFPLEPPGPTQPVVVVRPIYCRAVSPRPSFTAALPRSSEPRRASATICLPAENSPRFARLKIESGPSSKTRQQFCGTSLAHSDESCESSSLTRLCHDLFAMGIRPLLAKLAIKIGDPLHPPPETPIVRRSSPRRLMTDCSLFRRTG